MTWENELKTSLRDLDVPDHGPHFWAELEARLEEEPRAVARHSTTRKRRWRMPVALVAVAAAVLVVLVVALPPSLTATVLAYAYPQGTYTYDISYVDATDLELTGEGSIVLGPDSATEAEGTLTYTVEEDLDAETKTIGIRADVTGRNNLDGAIEGIPEVRFVVDSDGAFVRLLAPEPDQGIPGFVLPEPLPGSSRNYAGLPFGFGPPFPDHPLDVGDSWTTSGPRGAFAEDGPQFTAEHEVVGRETILGRETMIITSVYHTPAFEPGDGRVGWIRDTSYGPETADVTVWFDPGAGIIVRAELDRSTTSETRHENGQVLTSNGTTQMLVELTPDG
jgi:hypothetical protein